MDSSENKGSPFAAHEDSGSHNLLFPRHIDVDILPSTIISTESEDLPPNDPGVLDAPERALTIFAMRLAVLENMATGVGTLNFIWATVVILGGYAVTLKEEDFWFVTVILVTEGARIFGRSHELEWRQHDTRSLGEAMFCGCHSIGYALSSFLSSTVYKRSLPETKHEAKIHVQRPQSHKAAIHVHRPEAHEATIYVHRPAEAHRATIHANRPQAHDATTIDADIPQAYEANVLAHTTPQAHEPTIHALGTKENLHTRSRLAKPELHSSQPFHYPRTWPISHAPFLPFMTAKYISVFLYCLQILSAMVSIALSLSRLIHHNFTKPGEGEIEKNHRAALVIFYSLTVTEATIFLLKRAYWQYEVSVRKIVETAHNNCNLDEDDKTLYTMNRFFYDVLAKCLTASVFDGLKTDLVDYTLQWIHSDKQKEQLCGVKALYTCAMQTHSRQQTLRTIGRRQGTVERLVEMVAWTNEEERGVREAAAKLLSELVEYDMVSMRVASIPGSIEAIFSLLNDETCEEEEAEAEAERCSLSQLPAQEPWQTETLSHFAKQHVHLGLDIFLRLAQVNQSNCAKIGDTRGLLAKLLSFINISPKDGFHLQDPAIVEKSLQLLSHLAACHGMVGTKLRESIINVVASMAHLRKILGGHADLRLKLLAAEVVSSLAMDEGMREAIGRTGGMVNSLMMLFLKDQSSEMGTWQDQLPEIHKERCAYLSKLERQDIPETERKDLSEMTMEKQDLEWEEQQDLRGKVAVTAGRALSLLATGQRKNCERMVRAEVSKDVVEALMGATGDPPRAHLALFILRSFCENHVADLSSLLSRPGNCCTTKPMMNLDLPLVVNIET